MKTVKLGTMKCYDVNGNLVVEEDIEPSVWLGPGDVLNYMWTIVNPEEVKNGEAESTISGAGEERA